MEQLTAPTLRTKPAPRRPAVTYDIEAEGGKYFVTLGFDLDVSTPDSSAALPQVNEVFICGPKAGSELQSLLDDAAVLLSLAIQYGVPHRQLMHSLVSGRADGAASLLGKIVELVGAARVTEARDNSPQTTP